MDGYQEHLAPVGSPWTYLGSVRFIGIAERHSVRVEVLPIDRGRVFAVSGGLPLSELAKQRQSYRQLDLSRCRLAWVRRSN